MCKTCRHSYALRTFRLKYAGGNAERISFHPSSYVKLHIITVKLQLTGKSSLTYQVAGRSMGSIMRNIVIWKNRINRGLYSFLKSFVNTIGSYKLLLR